MCFILQVLLILRSPRSGCWGARWDVSVGWSSWWDGVLAGMPPATQQLQPQLPVTPQEFYQQPSWARLQPRFSPEAGELAFWFKAPPNTAIYQYNPINELHLHPQLASTNQRCAAANTVCSFVFLLGETVHSSMCLAFQARCLLCSAGCPLTCSIWQIRGDTLPPTCW